MFEQVPVGSSTKCQQSILASSSVMYGVLMKKTIYIFQPNAANSPRPVQKGAPEGQSYSQGYGFSKSFVRTHAIMLIPGIWGASTVEP